jgi:hypothetical protein
MPGINLQYGNIPVATRTALSPTSVNSAQVSTAQSVFGGASGLFSSVNSAVTIANSLSTLQFGTGDFTLEFRYYPISKAVAFPCIYYAPYTSSFVSGTWAFCDRHDSAPNVFSFWVVNSSGSVPLLSSTTTVSNGQWYALAVTRSGNTFRMFINGVLESTATFAGSLDNNTMSTVAFGTSGGGTNAYVNAYLDEIRISNIARYTATYTLATQAFTNDANTRLLLHCDGANASTSFPDDNLGTTPGGLTLQYGDIQTATRTALTTASVNNAQVSTAQSVFGNASALFSSVNSLITVTNSGSALTFGTGDFTYEMRYRPISKVTSFPAMVQAPYQSNFVGGAYNLMDRHDAVNTKFTFWVANFSTGAPLLTSTTTVANNTWYAIAITRSGSTFRMFINGTLEATATFAGSLDNNTMSVISLGSAGVGTNAYINGYIDEFRVSNIARYTATYTLATQPFVNDANTRLLLHCDGTNGSTSFPDDNLGTTAGGLTITY